MQKITSKDNEFIKHVKKLKDKKYRDEAGEYVIEGIKLIEEAIQENADIRQIVICEECEKTNAISKSLMYEISKFNCIYVTEKVFNSITQVVAPQGIFAVVAKKGVGTFRDREKWQKICQNAPSPMAENLPKGTHLRGRVPKLH